MKITEQTQTILQNFAMINDSIQFESGNELYTIANTRAVVGHATHLPESFPRFALYSLNKLLRSLSLFKDTPELTFEKTHLVASDKNSALEFFYSDESLIGIEKKIPAPPEKFLEFILTKEDLKSILDAAATLALPNVVLRKGKKGVELTATEVEVKSKNKYSVNLGNIDNSEWLDDNELVFLLSNISFFNHILKAMPCDLNVSILGKTGADKALAKFEFISAPNGINLTYYVSATI